MRRISLDAGATFMAAEDVPSFVLKHAWEPIWEAMRTNDLPLTAFILKNAGRSVQMRTNLALAVVRREMLEEFLAHATGDLVLE